MKKIFLLSCMFFLFSQASWAAIIYVDPGTSTPYEISADNVYKEYVGGITADFSSIYKFTITSGSFLLSETYGYYGVEDNNKITVKGWNSFTYAWKDASGVTVDLLNPLSAGTYTLTIDGDIFSNGDTEEPNPAYRFTITATPVPVPAAVWMLGTGLVAVLGMRRKMAA